MPTNAVPQGGVFFDFVSSDEAANNYLVSPGNTVYLLNAQGKKFYEKTYGYMQAYNLDEIPMQQVQQPQPNQNGLTKEEIIELIRQELSAYNPHIPRNQRRAN